MIRAQTANNLLYVKCPCHHPQGQFPTPLFRHTPSQTKFSFIFILNPFYQRRANPTAAGATASDQKAGPVRLLLLAFLGEQIHHLSQTERLYQLWEKLFRVVSELQENGGLHLIQRQNLLLF